MSRFMASINFNKQTEINVVDIQLATIDSGLSKPEIHVQGQNCQASIKSNKQIEIRGPVFENDKFARENLGTFSRTGIAESLKILDRSNSNSGQTQMVQDFQIFCDSGPT